MSSLVDRTNAVSAIQGLPVSETAQATPAATVAEMSPKEFHSCGVMAWKANHQFLAVLGFLYDVIRGIGFMFHKYDGNPSEFWSKKAVEQKKAVDVAASAVDETATDTAVATHEATDAKVQKVFDQIIKAKLDLNAYNRSILELCSAVSQELEGKLPREAAKFLAKLKDTISTQAAAPGKHIMEEDTRVESGVRKCKGTVLFDGVKSEDGHKWLYGILPEFRVLANTIAKDARDAVLANPTVKTTADLDEVVRLLKGKGLLPDDFVPLAGAGDDILRKLEEESQTSPSATVVAALNTLGANLPADTQHKLDQKAVEAAKEKAEKAVQAAKKRLDDATNGQDPDIEGLRDLARAKQQEKDAKAKEKEDLDKKIDTYKAKEKELRDGLQTFDKELGQLELQIAEIQHIHNPRQVSLPVKTTFTSKGKTSEEIEQQRKQAIEDVNAKAKIASDVAALNLDADGARKMANALEARRQTLLAKKKLAESALQSFLEQNSMMKGVQLLQSWEVQRQNLQKQMNTCDEAIKQLNARIEEIKVQYKKDLEERTKTAADVQPQPLVDL